RGRTGATTRIAWNSRSSARAAAGTPRTARRADPGGSRPPMTIDPSVTGRSYAHARSYEVGREKIREFADAIGDPDPLYRDSEAARERGYADVLAPPTF